MKSHLITKQLIRPPQVDQGLVDARELANLLGVKEGWVRQNMRIIPHIKLKRLVRFDPEIVKAHFKSTMV